MPNQATLHSVVESLEERRLLSSVLHVEGTRHDDTIVITRTANGRIDVDVNGVHRSVRARNVRRITVDAGRGNDDVSISNDNGGVRVLRSINAGSGDDTVVGGSSAARGMTTSTAGRGTTRSTAGRATTTATAATATTT